MAEENSRLDAYSASVPLDPVLTIIERAARDPAVDIEKLERLFALAERREQAQREQEIAERARLAELEFAGALARAQATFPIIPERGRIKIFSKALRERAAREGEHVYAGEKPQQETPYALWEDVIEGITPSLSREGLSLTFEVRTIETGESFLMVVTSILRHALGHSQTAETPPLKHDSSGSKNAIQAIKSTISYGKVIAAGLLVNFASRGENDDGQGGAEVDVITPEQLDALVAEVAQQGGNCLEQILTAFGIDALQKLPASRFAEATLRLHERRLAAEGRKPTARA